MSRISTRAAALSALTAGVALPLSFLVTPVDAVSTRSFVLDSDASLSAGELDGTAVHSDGSVTLGVQTRRIGLDEAAMAWCFARGSGAVFIGTGNDGKIYRLAGDDVSEFAATGQLVVTSLAFDGGQLYAGTLPEARIYKIDGQGQVQELARPDGAEHIWDLAVHDGTLYAATGPEGKVFAIDATGNAQVYWDSEASHVMSLAVADDGTLYAGTSDDAVVVRLQGPGRAEVVYDFPGNEVTAITIRDGILAVAANEFPDPPSAPTTTTTTTTTTTKAAGSTRPRAGKGRLYRIGSDGRTERVLAQEDGHYTSVQIAADGTIYAGAGKDGRIFRVSPNDDTATWIDVDERQVLAIDLTGNDPLFLTGDGAAIYRVVTGEPNSAIWTSKVLDASFSARFGELTWRGTGALSFQTRSGNSEEPNETWSEWSAAAHSPGPIRSPSARFLQVRARFPRDADARLLAVVAHYLPQNQRARLEEVGLKVAKKASGDAASKNRSADDPPVASSKLSLSWKVENPDEDRLRYRVRYRNESQSQWRDMLRPGEELTDDEYVWETSGLPDGWYIIEVEASDELANPETQTLRTRRTSEPLLVDNHPPIIDSIRVNGRRVVGRVVDSLGPIAKLEYAVDGRDFRPFFPVDDLLDTRDERFDLDLSSLPAGSHIIAVRAWDAGGNSVTAELTLP
jgi:outer membrane protein assembly factor BamB